MLVAHLHDLYAFYGARPASGSRASTFPGTPRGCPAPTRSVGRLNELETCDEQLAAVDGYFEQLAQQQRRLRYDEEELAA